MEPVARGAELVPSQDKERIKRGELRTIGAMSQIGELTGIGGIRRTKAFDISNTDGMESVGLMVVYEDGKSKHSDHRKFKIRTVQGFNDYVPMKEVLTRYFSHGMREVRELEDKGDDLSMGSLTRLSDLTMMGDGRGQVSIALEVLDKLGLSIPVCGMVKNDNYRTKGLYFNNIEIPIDRHNEEFYLIIRIQNEARRFVVEYHRSLKGKGQMRSILDDIPGIGPVRRKALTRCFKDTESVREAGVEKLEQAPQVNRRSAQTVHDLFHRPADGQKYPEHGNMQEGKHMTTRSICGSMIEIEPTRGGITIYRATITELTGKMEPCNATPGIDTDKIVLTHPDANRPAPQLTGFSDHFDRERVQIIGYAEEAYINTMNRRQKYRTYNKLTSGQIPCLVSSRSQELGEGLLKYCSHYGVPCLMSDKTISVLMAETIRWLNVKLAPRVSIHGALIDVLGEDVLIMGESGIGKSEATLELIKRDYHLVTDDVVEIRRISDDTLVGSMPDITKHFIGLCDIGIINVKILFDVGSIKDIQNINMAIKLEDWSKDKEYDQLGLEDNCVEFPGGQVICHIILIRSERSPAIIAESTAINYRQRKVGYNAARGLYRRAQASPGKANED